jgi:hypothetical protein
MSVYSNDREDWQIRLDELKAEKARIEEQAEVRKAEELAELKYAAQDLDCIRTVLETHDRIEAEGWDYLENDLIFIRQVRKILNRKNFERHIDWSGMDRDDPEAF